MSLALMMYGMWCKTWNFKIICLNLKAMGFMKTMGSKHLETTWQSSWIIMNVVISRIPYTSPTICKEFSLHKWAKTTTSVSKRTVNIKWVCHLKWDPFNYWHDHSNVRKFNLICCLNMFSKYEPMSCLCMKPLILS